VEGFLDIGEAHSVAAAHATATLDQLQ
jgi:hypothetical protein